MSSHVGAISALRRLCCVLCTAWVCSGCSPTVPSGVFTCDGDALDGTTVCPTGMFCVNNVCSDEVGEPDAGPHDSGTARSIVVSPSVVRVPEGGAETFFVRLSSPPNGTVELSLSVGGEVSPLTLFPPESIAFDETNWDVPMEIAVQEVAADTSVWLTVDESGSSDTTGYADVGPAAVEIAIVAEDALRIVSTPSQITIAEDGSAAVGLSLSAPPDGIVTVDVVPSGVLASPSRLTFSPDNWMLYAPVLIEGIDDLSASPDQLATVTVSVDEGGTDDTGYAEAPPTVITVTVVEDDEVGVVISPMAATLTEGETYAPTWRLTSEPNGRVCIDLPDFGDQRLSGWPASEPVCRGSVDDWNTPLPLPELRTAQDETLQALARTSLRASVVVDRGGTSDRTGYQALQGIEVDLSIDDASVPSVELSAPRLCSPVPAELDVTLGAQPEAGELVLEFISSDITKLSIPFPFLTIPANDWGARNVPVLTIIPGEVTLTAVVHGTSTATGYPPGPIDDLTVNVVPVLSCL